MDDVKRAVTECIRKAYDNPKGYIVASGCSLPTETPFENINTMIDTVREIGYPLNEDKISYFMYKNYIHSYHGAFI